MVFITLIGSALLNACLALQILRNKHLPLCATLGKTSAADGDKIGALKAAGAELATFFGHSVLANCYGLMELEMVSGPHNMGDHDVVLCEVGMHMTNRMDASDVLTTLRLRESGVLSGKAPSRPPPPPSQWT